MSQPNLKKRKLSNLADIDGDESKDNEETNTGNKLLSNIDKLNYMGPSSVLCDSNEVLDIVSIKNEFNELCNTDEGRNKILSLYHSEMKRHALGVNNIWKKKKNSNNKVVTVKQRIFAHIAWAGAVKPDGGGTTRYHALETMGVINSCALTVYKWKELKCRPDLGFTHSANVSKAFRIYIIIMYVMKLGYRFPNYVRLRTFDSYHKKVKGMAVKKNPDPDSIQLRTAITTAPFDIVKNVVTTNRQALTYAALPSPSPSNSVPPQVTPWTPQVKKSPSTQQLLAKADGLLNDIQNNMDDMNKTLDCMANKSKVLDWTDLDDTSDLPQVIAAEPTSVYAPISRPDKYDAQEHILYETAGKVMDIHTKTKEEEKVKDKVTNSLLQLWHIDEYKPHILGICKFIRDYKLSGIHKLKLLELDLDMLQQ